MEMEFNFKIKPLSILSILLYISVIGFLIFYFGYEKINREYGIVEIMTYLTGCVAVLSLIYMSKNSKETTFYNKTNHELLIEKNSYEAINKVIQPEMTESMRAFREVKKHIKENPSLNTVQPFLDHFKENPKDFTRICMLMNSFEQTAIQVKNKYVNEKTIKDAYETMFINSYNIMKPYIKHSQVEDGNECWKEFEDLCLTWIKLRN